MGEVPQSKTAANESSAPANSRPQVEASQIGMTANCETSKLGPTKDTGPASRRPVEHEARRNVSGATAVMGGTGIRYLQGQAALPDEVS